MTKRHSKRYLSLTRAVDPHSFYSLDQAVDILKSFPSVKFDETVELVIRLGLDTKHSDQQIRSTVVFPHGIGRSKKVLVFAKGEKENEATSAGADFVGSNDLLDKIKEGWMDFDVAIATPDMMRDVGKLGKVLGPRGLMPNPKTGTVTFDVSRAVKEFKAGKVEFRTDKYANVHVGIGKVSFDKEKLIENVIELIELIKKIKPSGSKGQYLKGISITTTMGAGLKISLDSVRKVA